MSSTIIILDDDAEQNDSKRSKTTNERGRIPRFSAPTYGGTNTIVESLDDQIEELERINEELKRINSLTWYACRGECGKCYREDKMHYFKDVNEYSCEDCFLPVVESLLYSDCGNACENRPFYQVFPEIKNGFALIGVSSSIDSNLLLQQLKRIIDKECLRRKAEPPFRPRIRLDDDGCDINCPPTLRYNAEKGQREERCNCNKTPCPSPSEEKGN
jgi:hypothetical protein